VRLAQYNALNITHSTEYYTQKKHTVSSHLA